MLHHKDKRHAFRPRSSQKPRCGMPTRGHAMVGLLTHVVQDQCGAEFHHFFPDWRRSVHQVITTSSPAPREKHQGFRVQQLRRSMEPRESKSVCICDVIISMIGDQSFPLEKCPLCASKDSLVRTPPGQDQSRLLQGARKSGSEAPGSSPPVT
jgi:hypothetical protein